MLQKILEVNTRVNEFIWGPAMIVAIVGVGIFLTVGTGFVQFRRFRAMLQETLSRKKRKGAEGDISPFAALSTALAGTVGVGNIAGAALTMSAFETMFGSQVGFSVVVLSMVLTAYDTMLAWGFYGETCSAYLFGPRARSVYRVLWLGPIMVGSLGELQAVWSLADTLNGLMAVPNLIALVFLGPVVFRLTKEFFAQSPKTELYRS